ncbi:MAG: retroviral-like aspartic protease family protein [Cyanobacteria bacterium J06554_3]
MPLGKLNIPVFEKNQMGKVTATITVANNVDQILAERGFIDRSEVRTLTLDNVLVDTGATMLSLPSAIAKQLGLPVKARTSVKTSAGSIEARIFSQTYLEINGRNTILECLELTELDIPLLGVLPMETLGLEPDLRNQQLRLLPMDENDTYIYAI